METTWSVIICAFCLVSRPIYRRPWFSIFHWCLVLWSFIFRSLVWTGSLILKTPFYTLNKWDRQAVSQNFDNFEYISFSDLWEDCALIDCVRTEFLSKRTWTVNKTFINLLLICCFLTQLILSMNNRFRMCCKYYKI